MVDPIRPRPARLAHIGIERVPDLPARPDLRVDPRGGERVADGPDMTAVQAADSQDEISG